MKRNDLIRLSGLSLGAVLMGCKEEVINELLPQDSLDGIEIDEARKYFEATYGKSLRAAEDKKPKRKIKWNKAEKYLSKLDKTDFELVWAPLEYEEDLYQAHSFFREENSYLESIRYLFQQPVYQALVVGKKKNKELFSYVVKLAFDPISMKFKEGIEFQMSHFSGYLIRATWEEDFQDIFKYENGEDTRTLSPVSSNAKVQSWITYYVTTDWYSQASGGGYTGPQIYLYSVTTPVTVCDHPARDYDLYEPVPLPSPPVYVPDATYVYNPPNIFLTPVI